jgi:hypothetical protein
MKRLLAVPILLLLAGFSGCSSTSQITTVDTLKVGLATAETLADIYVKMPNCGTPAVSPCRNPAAVLQIAKADQVAYDAIKSAAASAAAGQTVDLTAAQAALVAFQSLVTQYMPAPAKGATP